MFKKAGKYNGIAPETTDVGGNRVKNELDQTKTAAEAAVLLLIIELTDQREDYRYQSAVEESSPDQPVPQ